MWRYRFLHRDLEHLLESDPELAARYRAFAQRCLVNAKAIYRGFTEAGILRMNETQLEALTLTRTSRRSSPSCSPSTKATSRASCACPKGGV